LDFRAFHNHTQHLIEGLSLGDLHRLFSIANGASVYTVTPHMLDAGPPSTSRLYYGVVAASRIRLKYLLALISYSTPIIHMWANPSRLRYGIATALGVRLEYLPAMFLLSCFFVFASLSLP